MGRLVCAFVVRDSRKTGFLRSQPLITKGDWPEDNISVMFWQENMLKLYCNRCLYCFNGSIRCLYDLGYSALGSYDCLGLLCDGLQNYKPWVFGSARTTMNGYHHFHHQSIYKKNMVLVPMNNNKVPGFQSMKAYVKRPLKNRQKKVLMANGSLTLYSIGYF